MASQERKPSAGEAVIRIENLSFSYNGVPVLEDVDLAIAEHDLVSIIGPNGSGKTTLLRLILGVLRPERGTIRVLGLPPEKARPRVGYMPQHAGVDLGFPVSVTDVVLMGRLSPRRALGPFGGADRAAAVRALQEVEIHDLRHRQFGALSGGQRQRVLIARAIVSEPELLLLDEPTASLDALMEQELYDLLHRLNAKMTVVVVSHDLGFVSGFIKTVVCVKRQVIVHPTSDITGEIIKEMYGADVRMVRHDRQCREGEGGCPNS